MIYKKRLRCPLSIGALKIHPWGRLSREANVLLQRVRSSSEGLLTINAEVVNERGHITIRVDSDVEDP